jgi:hypothetical protein
VRTEPNTEASGNKFSQATHRVFPQPLDYSTASASVRTETETEASGNKFSQAARWDQFGLAFFTSARIIKPCSRPKPYAKLFRNFKKSLRNK